MTAHWRAPRQVTDSDRELGLGEFYELRAPDDTPLYDLAVDLRVVGWRVECFEARGFEYDDALALAMRRDIDRAYVERLLDEGATAAQIIDLVLL